MKTVSEIFNLFFGFEDLGYLEGYLFGKKKGKVSILNILSIFCAIYFSIFSIKKVGALFFLSTYVGIPVAVAFIIMGFLCGVLKLTNVSAEKISFVSELFRRALGFFTTIYQCYFAWTYLGIRFVAYLIIVGVCLVLHLGRKHVSDFSHNARMIVEGFITILMSI